MSRVSFLKNSTESLLFKNQGGVCFKCEDALDWEYKVVSFEENPTINDMGILCWSCWKDYKKGQVRHNK